MLNAVRYKNNQLTRIACVYYWPFTADEMVEPKLKNDVISLVFDSLNDHKTNGTLIRRLYKMTRLMIYYLDRIKRHNTFTKCDASYAEEQRRRESQRCDVTLWPRRPALYTRLVHMHNERITKQLQR